MSTVVIENVSLSFGAREILSDLSLRVADGDRIGVVGANGSGKSTLMRLVAGDQQPDSGTVRRARGVRIGWLPQDLALEGGRGLLDFVRSSVPGRLDLEAELVEAEKATVEASDEAAMMEAATRLAELHDQLARFDTLWSDHEAARILAGLGFKTEDLTRDIAEFSGGWKMRAVLGGLLFQQPDVLLLDEPTNHLDMPSVAWFADFLSRYPRAFLLISHDREFLNEQIRRVVSFEVEGVRQYTGNYEKYVAQRAEEEVLLENKAKNIEREREQTQQFIDRFRAQATKAKAVQSRIKALEKMETVETYRKRARMRFTFPPTERSSHSVVLIRELGKSYGQRQVLSNVNLTVYRGDRVGIVGPNGAGKTTLLKVIANELEATTGTVEIGSKVHTGYYAQHHSEKLHPKNTIFDEVSAENRELGQTRVRSVLGAFLFSGDDADKTVGVLSGGERARVALAKLLLKPGNFLLLDEPTNHLDLESCESLIESLESYDGAMLFVSHNRAVVRRLANKIWVVEDGTVTEYPGNLDDYLALSRARLSGEEPPPTPAKATPAKATPAKATPAKAPEPKVEAPPAESRGTREEQKARRREAARRREERTKKLGGLQKKVAELEARIAELEVKQKERNDALCAPEGTLADKDRYAMLDALQVDGEKIEELTERWEKTQSELDAAERELAQDDES